MIAKICLLTCALSFGQGGNGPAWSLVPRLGQAQELVYTGSFTEESLCPGVHFKRSYRLETKLLVLEPTAEGWNAAFLTSLQARPQGPIQGIAHADPPVSVRLEIAEVSSQGQVKSARGIDLQVPTDGPPTLECGSILLVPKAPVRNGDIWEVRHPGQPLQTWKVLGTEIVSNTPCVKVEGTQQSSDWEKPRADSTAWKRTETVWIAPQNGIVYRVERIIERRDPARKDPTHRSVVRFEKDSHLTYPAQFFQDCRTEVLQGSHFIQEAEKYLQQPGQFVSQLEVLEKKIDFFLLNRPQSPYRKAIHHLQQRIKSAKQGEVIAFQVAPPLPHTAKKTTIGTKIPDFSVTNLATNQVVEFKHYVGRPMLVIFYNPSTTIGFRVMRFAQKIQEEHKSKVLILGMAVTNDVPKALEQQKLLKLSFPILDGRGFHRIFGVDATPRCVIVDGTGWIRGGYTGWGVHTPEEIQRGLHECLHPPEK